MLRLKLPVFITITLFLSACASFSLAEDITPPPGSNLPEALPTQVVRNGPLYPLVPPNPANGESIYNENCASCHGETGKGDGPRANQLPKQPYPLTSPVLIRSAKPVEWYTIVTKGDLERFMPPFANLTERQRWDVIAYLYMLSTPVEAVAQGEELFQASCFECHGEGGQGDGSRVSGLESTPTNFTDLAFMAKISDQELFLTISDGVVPTMSAYGGTLSEGDRWALVAYLRSLTFAFPTEKSASETTPTTDSVAEPEATGTPSGSTSLTDTGTVKGIIIQMSGDDNLAGMIVTLHGFDNMQESIVVTTTVQDDGTYIFENIEMPVSRVFVASVEYDQATYGSDISMVEENITNLELPIPIYASTTDSNVLVGDRLHIFFEYIEPDTLRVFEILIISNLSDRTLVPAGEGNPTIAFTLPGGATNLQFEDGTLGGRFVETPNGFGDTAVIRPGSGQHQVTFAIDIPYKRKLNLSQPLNMPVNSVIILVPEGGLKIKSDLLQHAGTRDIQGMTYQMYTSDRLEAGTQLSITISGSPIGGGISFATDSYTSLIIGLAAFGLALIATGVWVYRRRRDRTTAEDANAEDVLDETTITDALPNDPDALMDAIITLDDLYQAGELPEEAYSQRRAEIKERLKKITDTLTL